MIAQQFFNQTALIAQERTWSYGELDSLVGAMCFQLARRGVFPGARVVFLGRNDWQTVVLFLALFRLRAIACPLNPRIPLAAALERLATPFFFDPHTFILKETTDADREDETAHATLLFTSGSTAAPKLACHSLGNHLDSARASLQLLPLGPGNRWLLSLPLFHVGGLAILFRCFLSGAAVLLPPIGDLSATHASLVPTQLFRFLREGRKPSFRTVLLGGAPITPSLCKEAREEGWNILPTYGMTEMSSQITLCGTPLPSCCIRLAEDKEIFVRGKTLFQGYWEHRSGLSLPCDKEGWFATGDLGEWTEEGKLALLGRKDNLFISGGENIQPEEIEAALLALPGIAEALVLPVPDAEFGQRPAAFIQPFPLYPLEKIQELLKHTLPSYKIPTRLFPFPEQGEGIKRERKRLQSWLQDLQKL